MFNIRYTTAFNVTIDISTCNYIVGFPSSLLNINVVGIFCKTPADGVIALLFNTNELQDNDLYEYVINLDNRIQSLVDDTIDISILSVAEYSVVKLKHNRLNPYLNTLINSDHTQFYMIDDNNPIVREVREILHWREISESKNLSENFIRNNKDYVDWDSICQNQKLSEDFIMEFSDRVNWWLVSIFQPLSEDFIKRFKDYVDWDMILIHQNISDELRNKFRSKVRMVV